MKKAQNNFVLLLALLFLLSSLCTPVMGEEKKADMKRDDTIVLFDVALVRPICIGATAVGLGLFIFWAPFSFPFGTLKDSWNILVVKPANYTFKRPLGEL